MWRIVLFTSLLVVACLSAPARAQEREWTYASGGKFKAKLVRELDGEAIFLKDRKFLSVPLDELSEADRKFVLAAGQGKSESDAADSAATPTRTAKTGLNTDEKVAPLVKPKTPVVNRDWTDTSGNRTYGKFVRVYERNVIILRGARPASLPYDDLSLADQNYVNQILTERGEQPFGAPADDDPPAQPASDNAAPGSAAPYEPPPADDPSSEPVARGSRFYDELRQRQEERRQQQEEYAAQNPMPKAEPPAGEPDAEPAPAVLFNQPPIAPPDGPGHTDASHGSSRATGGLRIDGKTVAEVRPVLIMAGVLLGLFAVLGVIVFVATTIASSNTPRHQRRLY